MVYRIGFCFRMKKIAYMANWIVTIGALNCFEDLISRVNFVKLTLKSIYEEWTLTNSIKPNTQQRGRTQFQAKRTKHKVGHKGTKWIVYLDCSKTSTWTKVCTTRFVWWVTQLSFNKKKTCFCFNYIVTFVVNRTLNIVILWTPKHTSLEATTNLNKLPYYISASTTTLIRLSLIEPSTTFSKDTKIEIYFQILITYVHECWSKIGCQ